MPARGSSSVRNKSSSAGSSMLSLHIQARSGFWCVGSHSPNHTEPLCKQFVTLVLFETPSLSSDLRDALLRCVSVHRPTSAMPSECWAHGLT